MKRRAFLRGLAGSAVLGGVASATHPRQQPDHVTITYDKATLEKYRPLLVTSHLNVQPMALYGWIATSPEYEYDWHVYWAAYTHQNGVSSYDSHYGDHEPVYVGVKNGQADRVLYSGYHWLKATAVGASIPLYQNTHPAFRVIRPWHHFALDADKSGSFVEVRDLNDVFQAWLDNGLESALDPGAVVNPASMRSRPDWWQSDAAGVSFNAVYVRALLAAGFHGGDRVDKSRISG